MFRRYSLTYVEDTVVVQFRGDVPSRRFAWMGAVDALLLAGHQRFVINLEGLTLQRDSDAGFVVTVAQHIRECGGEAVFMPPSAPDAQRHLRRGSATAQLPFVDTVESGVEKLTADEERAAPAERRWSDPTSLLAHVTRSARRRLARGPR